MKGDTGSGTGSERTGHHLGRHIVDDPGLLRYRCGKVAGYKYYAPFKNPRRRTCYPLPPRDSQARKTAASMRLYGNQKAKPSRRGGRKRTGGEAALASAMPSWRAPKDADHGARKLYLRKK